MKRKISVFLAVAFLVLSVCTASAHPPKSVTLSLEPGGVLRVSAEHAVNDPAKHYINKVIIYVDDKITAQREYASQTSAEGYTDVFSIGAVPSGSRIKAEVKCVIMGSVSSTITAP